MTRNSPAISRWILAATGARPARDGGALRRALRRTAARGFSMTEMLAVMLIVALLAAIALPAFYRSISDKHVQDAAIKVSGLYRLARARAMGRGAAINVRWNKTGTLFEAREAIAGGPDANCAPLPATSCVLTDWSASSKTSRRVDSLEINPEFQDGSFSFQDPAGDSQDYAEICFTARGRAFVRYKAVEPFVPLTGAPRIDVINTYSSTTRRVLIPPNGVARLSL